MLLFSHVHNGLNVLSIIYREDAAQSVGAKVLNKGTEESVAVFEQQAFELFRIGELAAIGHFTTGIYRWILAFSLVHSLVRAPLANCVELIKR